MSLPVKKEFFYGFCWKVSHVVIGFFLYPIFGFLAFIGMTFKFFNVLSIASQNETQIDEIVCHLEKFKNYEPGIHTYSCKPMNQIRPAHEYEVTRENMNEQGFEIGETIRGYTEIFKKTYIDLSRDERGARIRLNIV